MTTPGADSNIGSNIIVGSQPAIEEVTATPVALEPKLPLDLIPHVVDHLSGMLPVLKACALASLSFFQASRPHLHSGFTIKLNPDRASRLENVVARLQFYIANPPPDNTTQFESLFLQLGPFPNVKKLTLNYIDFSEGTRLFAHIAHNFPSVRSLAIGPRGETKFTDLEQVTSLVHSFPLLRNIDLDQIKLHRGDKDVEASITEKTTRHAILVLDSLRLSGPRTCGLDQKGVRRLLGIEPGMEDQLVVERLSIHQRTEREKVQDAIDLFGSSLRHLTLDTYPRKRFLSKCHRLETLRVRTAFYEFDLGWLLELPSPHLKKLILDSNRMEGNTIVKDLRLSRLDTVLEEREGKVEEVLILIDSRHRMISLFRDIKAKVLKAMPKTPEKGIIRFEYRDVVPVLV
ncbi:hypothetical protein NLI96_g4449 [Meripilus lineatus]|uniref:Uncharacterized protein n=1 Tax=Meripilus lineatus TaxID=2056292 RepID=A0AAD5YJX6_9APHY|nr:hypothetical protein NLI96_g4449 [Physisporinus lineatus]